MERNVGRAGAALVVAAGAAAEIAAEVVATGLFAFGHAAFDGSERAGTDPVVAVAAEG